MRKQGQRQGDQGEVGERKREEIGKEGKRQWTKRELEKEEEESEERGGRKRKRLNRGSRWKGNATREERRH